MSYFQGWFGAASPHLHVSFGEGEEIMLDHLQWSELSKHLVPLTIIIYNSTQAAANFTEYYIGRSIAHIKTNSKELISLVDIVILYSHINSHDLCVSLLKGDCNRSGVKIPELFWKTCIQRIDYCYQTSARSTIGVCTAVARGNRWLGTRLRH